MRRCNIIPLCITFAACGTETAPDTAALPPATDTLEITQHIAADDGPASFGRVQGVVAHPDGRILVVDGLASEARVFDPDGAHRFTFGGKGAGPMEFDGPCCPALRGDTLWIRDGGNARYSAFVLGDSAATPAGTVRFTHGDNNRVAPLNFDADGHLLDLGLRVGEEGRQFHQARLARDGSIVESRALHEPPADSIGQFSIRQEVTGGVTTWYAYQPFGPAAISAHGPGGSHVHGVSSRYRLEWRDGDGELVRTIEGPALAGPRLTDEERATADERITEMTERLGVARRDLGFDVPDRKPPLVRAFFDGDGRLWVQLAVSPEEMNRAHVYDTGGELLTEIVWPARISIAGGYADAQAVWGVAFDEYDVPSLVRLEPRGD